MFDYLNVEQPLDRSDLKARTGTRLEGLIAMIILGIILLIAGFLLKISILWTIGIVVLVIGVILAILGATGRAVGGRRHYF
ncbi:MAG: hypothetical protein JO044_00340 [Mycobacteriaceae bacterium]|nr:hypothetical protein [Mycobacteriaceae bacterium]MBV9639678.1 hypothetical protein [Mycobacteriaceae bacterium]